MPILDQPHFETERDRDHARAPDPHPESLGLIAPPRVVAARLARDAAAECAVRPHAPHFTHLNDGPFVSTELLGLLTFSYGTGIFSLERLYDQLDHDILCRSFITGAVPHPDTLRRFRQIERKTLQSALDQFFRGVVSLLDRDLTCASQRQSFLAALGLHKPVPACDQRRHRMVVDRVNQATWVDRMMDF